MTTIRTEEWNGHQIRFVQHKDEWWAIAKDVASALGYNHTPSMVRMLDQDEKGVHILHTPGGNQKNDDHFGNRDLRGYLEQQKAGGKRLQKVG